MILYRYFKAHDAINTLGDCMLRASKLSEVNDPFELSWRPEKPDRVQVVRYVRERLNDPIFREYATLLGVSENHLLDENVAVDDLINADSSTHSQLLQKRFQWADNEFRAICFSSNDIDPVADVKMWSLYADKHRGLRIGFEFQVDVTQNCLKEINYSLVRPSVNLFADTDISINSATKTKSEVWRYEKEKRLYIPLDHCIGKTINGVTMEFYKFNPICIKSIDIGLNCDQSARIVELRNSLYKNVSLNIVKMHHENYSLVYEPIQ